MQNSHLLSYISRKNSRAEHNMELRIEDVQENDWSDDITLLPNISWKDVTTYLIDTPSKFTNESLKAYKSLEAYDYFVCGHVQKCFTNNANDSNTFCYIKGKVCEFVL